MTYELPESLGLILYVTHTNELAIKQQARRSGGDGLQSIYLKRHEVIWMQRQLQALLAEMQSRSDSADDVTVGEV